MDIYKITAGDYYYYGQTINTGRQRWIAHKSALRHNKHGNGILQNIWNKHGEEAFSFEVIFSCEDKELLDLVEEEFIDKYIDDPYCANICRIANAPGSRKGAPKSKEWRKKMSGAGNGRARAVVVNGVVYPTTKEAADAIGVLPNRLTRWLKGTRTAPKKFLVSYHGGEK